MMLLTNNASFNASTWCEGSSICQFGNHQSIVIGSKLYVDGGSFVSRGDLKNNGYRDIRVYDLSRISQVDVGGKSVSVPQTAIITRPASVANVRMGWLWTDPSERYIYRYGGNWIDPPDVIARINNDSSRSALVGMDTKSSNTSSADAWYLPPNASPPTINRLAYGAGARSVNTYEGFYLGGFDDLSGNDHKDKGTELASLRNSLVTWNGKSNEWSNITVTKTASSSEPHNPGAAGVLLHVPIGTKGMLVSIGGHEFEGDSPRLSMKDIRIFNINDGKWYVQTAVGDIPSSRMFFCGVMSAAPDNSSFNIYISGGLTSDQGLDDVYILSIPSFRWVRAYSGSGPPRQGHSCEIVQGKQMAVIGGFNATSLPSQACGLEMGGDLRFFDMSTLIYTEYSSTPVPYSIPDVLSAVIGGSATGGSTVISPVAGWTDPLFEPSWGKAISNTPSSSSSAAAANGDQTSNGPTLSSGRKTALIAGGVAGGAVIFTLILCMIYSFLVRRRQGRQDDPLSHHSRNQSDRSYEIRFVMESSCRDLIAPKPLPLSPTTLAGDSPFTERTQYGFPYEKRSQLDYDRPPPTPPPAHFSQPIPQRAVSPPDLPACTRQMTYDAVQPAPLRPLCRSKTATSSNPTHNWAREPGMPTLRKSKTDEGVIPAVRERYERDYARTRGQPTKLPQVKARQVQELPASHLSRGEEDSARRISEGLPPPIYGNEMGEKF